MAVRLTLFVTIACNALCSASSADTSVFFLFFFVGHFQSLLSLCCLTTIYFHLLNRSVRQADPRLWHHGGSFATDLLLPTRTVSACPRQCATSFVSRRSTFSSQTDELCMTGTFGRAAGASEPNLHMTLLNQRAVFIPSLAVVLSSTLNNKADAGADIMCGILNGLTYLHETANMVHLDLKPENILLGEGDAPKLADFDAALPLFCETDVVRGTRDVHPPELVANEPLYKMILASADIWSVGVLAHVLVTGTHPWGAAELNDPKFEDFCSYGVAGGDDRVTTPTKQSPTDPHSPLWCRLPPDLANAFGLMLSLEPQNRGNAGFVHDMVRQCWKTDVDEVRETAATAGKNAENQRPARELKYQWSRSPIRRKKFFSPGSQKKYASFPSLVLCPPHRPASSSSWSQFRPPTDPSFSCFPFPPWPRIYSTTYC